jgi:hypothetical protein
MSSFVLPVSHISGQQSDARSKEAGVDTQPHLIETATTLALCSENSTVCYTVRN